MKKKAGFLVTLCATLLLTVGLARVAVACSGAVGWHHIDHYGASCSLTGSDSQWCYYDCTCYGLSESGCDSFLTAHGMLAY